jgi:hypothetical protein
MPLAQTVEIQIIERDAGRAELECGVQLCRRANQKMQFVRTCRLFGNPIVPDAGGPMNRERAVLRLQSL